MRSVVVLPQPDGPSSEKNSPALIEASMASTASVSSYCLVRARSWTSPGISASIPESSRSAEAPPREDAVRRPSTV